MALIQGIQNRINFDKLEKVILKGINKNLKTYQKSFGFLLFSFSFTHIQHTCNYAVSEPESQDATFFVISSHCVPLIEMVFLCLVREVLLVLSMR